MLQKNRQLRLTLATIVMLLSFTIATTTALVQRPITNSRGTIYVGHVGGISVIDSASNLVVARIPIKGLAAIAISPDGSRIFGMCYGEPDSQFVMVVDTATNAVIASIPYPPVFQVPGAMAINPAGTRLYVGYHGPELEGNVGRIAVIDTTTNTILENIVVGANPQGIVVNPSGTRVYANHYPYDVYGRGDWSLSIIDTSSNTVIHKLSTGEAGFGFGAPLAISNDGGTLYAGVDQIVAFDTGTNRWVEEIVAGAGARGMTFDRSGRLLYVAGSSSNSLSIVDMVTKSVEALPVGVNPRHIALNTAGSRAYVVNVSGNSLTVIDTNTKSILKTIGVGANPIGVIVSP